MQPIQKQLDKKDKELPKQMSENVNNKKIPHAESKKNQKLEVKIISQDQKKNLHIDNHLDSEISHEKITKHSSHNLKYLRKLIFKNHLNLFDIFIS